MTMVAGGASTQDRHAGRDLVRAEGYLELTLLASSMALGNLGRGRTRSAGLTTKVATIVLEIGVIVAFAVIGMGFIGLAIASPVALPMAQQSRVAVSTAEIAVVQQLGSVWWLFALGVVLSFGAALATLMNLMRRMEPANPNRLTHEVARNLKFLAAVRIFDSHSDSS
jgi:hypothetical protein